jgi:hypothetical protein
MGPVTLHESTVKIELTKSKGLKETIRLTRIARLRKNKILSIKTAQRGNNVTHGSVRIPRTKSTYKARSATGPTGPLQPL